jgi:DNA-binding Lrp family transcriptional regulator
MTKQEQIAELDDGTRTTREIAELVGCSPPYVRAARQRLAGSDVDKRYREKFKQKHGMSRSGWRYRHYPEDRAKRSEYAKHRWANDREDEYQADIVRRMELAANPSKRAAVAATKNQIDDLGPLFAGLSEAAE